MKYIALAILSCIASACASDPPPPAASSATVDVATNTPSASTEPVKTDVMLAAEADRRSEQAARAPALEPQANAPAANAEKAPAPATAAPAPASPAATSPTRTAAVDNAASTPAPPSAPDNSRVNARDRSGDTLTPVDQGGSEADRKLTQQVRQAVMQDSSLSFAAKNIKIITVNGKVTLRGPVKTEQERAAIDAAAKRIAGASQVENLLELKK